MIDYVVWGTTAKLFRRRFMMTGTAEGDCNDIGREINTEEETSNTKVI